MNREPHACLKEACEKIFPISPLYTNEPIDSGFDWSPLDKVPFERLYLVVFRSIRRADADSELLREHDDRAYEEALRSGGLLLYFKGVLNERRECLSFCLWETREQAVRASAGARHGKAAEISALTYEIYDLERYDLLKQGDRLLFRPVEPLVAAV
jgi:hypothetical protein